jgi:FAD/FMN-containing dehydrogenase
MQEYQLTGDVIFRGQPGYGEARREYNVRFDYFPEVVVFCRNTADVQNAVRWARSRGVPIRLRCGRHSYEAYSTADNAIVIDVGRMERFVIAGDRKTAEIGAGTPLLEVYQTLFGYGVTIPGGSCPTVGVTGLVLGGGFGLLSRLFGITCDSLLGVEMVTADGDVIRADENENPDLFWACQGGGGGNFGIVTSLRFKLHPIANVVIYNATWTWDAQLLADVMNFWQQWAKDADRRVTAIFKCTAPASRSFATIGQFVGPQRDLTKLIYDQLLFGAPKVSIQTMPYIEAISYFGGLKDPSKYSHWTIHEAAKPNHQRFKNTSAYVYDPLPAEAIGKLVGYLEKAPNALGIAQFDNYGGAVADRKPTDSAFYHREASYNIQYQTYWTDPIDDVVNIEWVDAMRAGMQPYTTGGYVNYIDADVPDYLDYYYGPNKDRLMKVKRQYDPDDVFRFAQSVPPA